MNFSIARFSAALLELRENCFRRHGGLVLNEQRLRDVINGILRGPELTDEGSIKLPSSGRN